MISTAFRPFSSCATWRRASSRLRSQSRTATAPSFQRLRDLAVQGHRGQAKQVWQYAQLLRKAAAGADFIISQLGFELGHFEELIAFVRQRGLSLPVLANVFIPSLPVARAMAAGKVPGVLLPPELLARMERAVKRLLFNCRMCGDCTLPRSVFLCPQSGCPNRLVNGTCGGSRFGFWVRVY
ncbi:MAG: methylenetetrahydrofolate reductase C-terminal domain-containing protein [Candidatus Electronema sp. VV]